MGLHKTAGNLAVSKRENQAVVLEEDYDKNEAYEGFNPNSEEAHIILSLYQSAYRNQSLQLAANLQSTVEKEKIRKNLGVKEAGFLVLWKTAMPSVLVESGFLTNPDDKKFLISGAGQDKMAQSILESIQTYKTQLEKK